jgi:hypothetical protein
VSAYREVAIEPRKPFVLTILLAHPAFFLAPLVLFVVKRAPDRPLDGSPWRLALVLLVVATFALVCLRRRRVVVDYESGTLVLHGREAPLDRVVRVHHTTDLRIIVTLDDGEDLTLFPGGRSEYECTRNAIAIREAIHRYSKNF